MARRKAPLSDDEAIAIMILHNGGHNPILDIRRNLAPETPTAENLLSIISVMEPFWVLLNPGGTVNLAEVNLAEAELGWRWLGRRWFATEADAARAYCKFYELE